MNNTRRAVSCAILAGALWGCQDDKGKSGAFMGDPAVLVVRELPCPEAGTCLSHYGKDTPYGASIVCDRLFPSITGDLDLCGADPEPCDPNEPGSCEEDQACVTNYREYCPECTATMVCALKSLCGDEVPTERCLFPPPAPKLDSGIRCAPDASGCGTGSAN